MRQTRHEVAPAPRGRRRGRHSAKSSCPYFGPGLIDFSLLHRSGRPEKARRYRTTPDYLYPSDRSSNKETTMTMTMTERATALETAATAIRPFRVKVPE